MNATKLQDALRELFWNSTTMESLPTFVLSLVAAAILGALLGQAYIYFGRSLSNRRVFAANFLLLTVTTTLIITIVKSSLALSLGLVGALSIVRFRAAIKEPEELAFLFLAISVGLGLGAGQALITVVALVVILGLIAIRGLVHRNPPQPNLYLTVTCPAAGRPTASQLMSLLKECGAAARLKRFDENPQTLEAAFLVDFRDVGKLDTFGQRLRALHPEVRLSCLDDGATGV
jgi:uncharacterized membrane protein YhiD involved in acid resistance